MTNTSLNKEPIFLNTIVWTRLNEKKADSKIYFLTLNFRNTSTR